jgi:undecaprenyl-phosphate 4-deoxy-4-formamido-L-arabinose transferase
MFVNFSVMPLRISSMIGLLFSLIGLVLSIAVVVEKLNNPALPIGWPSVIITALVFAGIQLFMLGLIGEYLGRLFLSANQTPQYVVRNKIGGEEQDGA